MRPLMTTLTSMVGLATRSRIREILRPSLLPVTVALMSACSEGMVDSGLADSDAELLAHTPPAGSPLLVLPPPDYAQLDGGSVRSTPGSLHLVVDAAGEIPQHPDPFIQSVAVFGYAWADLDTGSGLVAVIHPTIGRDSKQNPDGWHTHPVQLAAGTAASSFCIVSIGRSQAGVAKHEDILGMNLSSHWAGLDASALDVAAAFIVQLDAGCSGTGLGVAVLGTAAPLAERQSHEH
jgi:hypothetical protein